MAEGPTRDQILGFLTELNTELAGEGMLCLQVLKEENFVNAETLLVNQGYLLAWKQTVDQAVTQIAVKWLGEGVNLDEDLKKWAQMFKEDEQFVYILKEINAKTQSWRTIIKSALMKDQSIFTMPESKAGDPTNS
jgi:nickel-dependent lactate racemase